MEPVLDAPQYEGASQQSPAGGIWRVVGASVRGVSHERMDLPCQDALGYRVLPGGFLLAAVADGAGTASLSDQGAWTAVECMLNALEVSLHASSPANGEAWTGLLRDAFVAAREAVLELAEKAGVKPRELACTLVGVVAAPDGLVAGLIGDGAVVCQDGSGDLFSATRLQRGEYANETHFLVDEDALKETVIDTVDRPVRSVALMSDGLIRLALKLPAQEPHVPFFQPLFRFAAAEAGDARAIDHLEHFLDSPRVKERTDDDMALVLAVRIDSAEGTQDPGKGNL